MDATPVDVDISPRACRPTCLPTCTGAEGGLKGPEVPAVSGGVSAPSIGVDMPSGSVSVQSGSVDADVAAPDAPVVEGGRSSFLSNLVARVGDIVEDVAETLGLDTNSDAEKAEEGVRGVVKGGQGGARVCVVLFFLFSLG